MYYVARVDDLFGRFPVPSLPFEWMPLTRALTWSVLVVEIVVPLLVWHPRTRRLAVAVAICLHLGIEYTMNLFLFQWLMILGWSTFLTADDWRALLGRLPRRKVGSPRSDNHSSQTRGTEGAASSEILGKAPSS